MTVRCKNRQPKSGQTRSVLSESLRRKKEVYSSRSTASHAQGMQTGAFPVVRLSCNEDGGKNGAFWKLLGRLHISAYSCRRGVLICWGESKSLGRNVRAGREARLFRVGG